VKQKTTLNTGFNEPESRSCLYEPNLRSSKAFIKASSSFLILKRLIKNVEDLYSHILALKLKNLAFLNLTTKALFNTRLP